MLRKPREFPWGFLYPVPALLPGEIVFPSGIAGGETHDEKGVEGAACIRAAHGIGRATPQAKSRSALGGPGGQLIKCLSGFLFRFG